MIAVTIISRIGIELEVTSYSIAFRFTLETERTYSSAEKAIA